MVKVSNDDFISKFIEYFNLAKERNSIYLTLKRGFIFH